MNCYVCAVAGTENSAVAICGACLVGLCSKHLDENARRRGLLGARGADCVHHLGYDQDPPRITRIPISAGNDRAPAA